MMAILDTLSTRLKSPYFGSFALAWLGSTWQVWYVTIFVSVNELPRIPGTDIRYNDKLSYIWSLELGWCRLLVVPVILGFLTPWALHYVEGWLTYLRKSVDQHWAGKDKTKFGDDAYVTRKEQTELAEQLRQALYDKDQFRSDAFQIRKQLEDTQRDLGNLRSANDNLASEADRLKKANEEVHATLQRLQREFAAQRESLFAAQKSAADTEEFTTKRLALARYCDAIVRPLVAELRHVSAKYQERPFTEAIEALDSIEGFLRGKYPSLPETEV